MTKLLHYQHDQCHLCVDLHEIWFIEDTELLFSDRLERRY